MTSFQEHHRHLAGRIAEVGDSQLDSTAPLYLELPGGRLRFLASSLLLGVEEERFLVTAGHVFDDIGKAILYTGGSKLVSVGGEWRHSQLPGLGRNRDPYDLAVLRLPPEQAEAIDIVPIFPGDTDPLHDPEAGGTYVAVGYPDSRQSTFIRDGSLEPKQLYLAARPAGVPAGTATKFDPARNLSLTFDKYDMVSPDGALAVAPDPVGMSGCGIWVVHDLAGTTPLRPRLAGIAIVWLKDLNRIIGTRVGLCFDAIVALCPGLEKALPLP